MGYRKRAKEAQVKRRKREQLQKIQQRALLGLASEERTFSAIKPEAIFNVANESCSDVHENELLLEVEYFPTSNEVAPNVRRSDRKPKLPVYIPKPEEKRKLKPVSTGESFLICALCVRECIPKLMVKFSARRIWNCFNIDESQDKLQDTIGISVDLRTRAVCHSCWSMVELLSDFRTSCQKAAEWASQYSFGLPRDEDSKENLHCWLSDESTKMVKHIDLTIQEHTVRIEMDQVAARNAQEQALKKTSLDTNQSINEPNSFPDNCDTADTNVDDCDVDEKWWEASLDDDCNNVKKEFPNTTPSSPTEDLVNHSNEEPVNKLSNKTPSSPTEDLANHSNEEPVNELSNKTPSSPVEDLFNQSDEMPVNVECNSINTDVPVWTCEKCKGCFNSKQALVPHAKTCNGTAVALHHCTICSVNFVTKDNLTSHLNKHKGIKPYKCRKGCNKSYYGRTILSAHEQLCKRGGTICSLCGAKLKNLLTLKRHMRGVHGNATIPCKVCGKIFRSRIHIEKHMTETHSDVRGYPCTVCGKAFKNAYTLKVHNRIHTQEKPFSCTICGQGFAYKCLVQPHIQRAHCGDNGND